MQLLGMKRVERGLLASLRFVEALPRSTEATNASVGISMAIEHLQRVRSINEAIVEADAKSDQGELSLEVAALRAIMFAE